MTDTKRPMAQTKQLIRLLMVNGQALIMHILLPTQPFEQLTQTHLFNLSN